MLPTKHLWTVFFGVCALIGVAALGTRDVWGAFLIAGITAPALLSVGVVLTLLSFVPVPFTRFRHQAAAWTAGLVLSGPVAQLLGQAVDPLLGLDPGGFSWEWYLWVAPLLPVALALAALELAVRRLRPRCRCRWPRTG